MQTKLIKLEQGFILVSDETPIIDDFALYGKYIRKVDNTFNQPGMDWNALNTRKIIASNFIDELPPIDFNGLEEELGVIDLNDIVDELDNELIPFATEEFEKWNIWRNGIILGFNKCLSINKDKLYTEENVREAIIKGYYTCMHNMTENSSEIKDSDFKNIIQSLQPKSEWNVEVSKEKDSIKIIKIS